MYHQKEIRLYQAQEEVCGYTHCQRPPTCYGKKFRVPESIGDPIKYTKYKTGNEVLFRGLDIGLIESSLCVKVEEHILTKDVRAVFLDIGA